MKTIVGIILMCTLLCTACASSNDQLTGNAAAIVELDPEADRDTFVELQARVGCSLVDANTLDQQELLEIFAETTQLQAVALGLTQNQVVAYSEYYANDVAFIAEVENKAMEICPELAPEN